LAALCAFHFVTRYAWRSWNKWANAVRAVQVLALALASTTIMATVHRTSLPDFVETLPVRAQLLPLSPEMPKGATTGQQRLLVQDLEIRWNCQNSVCAFFAQRPGFTKRCGLLPIIEGHGPLQLRNDVRHGVWFFDGVHQNWPLPAPRAQLAFRHVDAACVDPRDADISDTIRPTGERLAMSLIGCLASLLLLTRPLRKTRDAAYRLCAALTSVIPVLPWVFHILGPH